MSLASVTELLRERIGLDPELLGPTALNRAVAARLQALGLNDAAAYATRLAVDGAEFQTLAAELAVPESWFFRGGELFTYLARSIAEGRLSRYGQRYRILSVACSTGEEPYSLAIALSEASVARESWELEGIDLSHRHIERARQGTYSELSFRQTEPELRGRYFRPVQKGWELLAALRSTVSFRIGNLLEPLFLSGEAPFDLIFCRNLFIYLHAEARRRALDTLYRLLAPQGWICMGHVEPLEFLDPRFHRTGPNEFFLYVRAAASLSAPRPAVPLLPRPHQAAPAVPSIPAPLARTKPNVAPAPSAATRSPADLLAEALRQADRGQVDEALATCRRLLASAEPSADLFSLMGALHHARHEPDEAMSCYQRALYLQPQHVDALTHLMYLYRQKGDPAQALRLQQRLERAVAGGTA